MTQREVPRLRIVKQPRDLQVEVREESEHEAGHDADGERDHEAGAVHARFLAEGAHGGKMVARMERSIMREPASPDSRRLIRVTDYRTNALERGRSARHAPALRPANTQ